MTQIQWRDVPEPVVEQMLAVLLSHLYGGSTVRIDGRGGDGGRDVQFETPDGIHAFEIKSFTGRLTPGRRSKIQASLTRAARLAPLTWTLLVPIGPNPAELKWFDWLRTTVSFPLTMRGLTWLDLEMAQRSFIGRYYIEGADDRLMEMSRQFGQERAALERGLPDAIDRLTNLARLANDLDPHYRFELSSDGTSSSVSIVPRYAGAELARPITARFTAVFPADEAGKEAAAAFQQSLDYGTPVTVPSAYVQEMRIDAPANLGGRFEGGVIEVKPVARGKAVDLHIAVVRPDGRVISSLPVSLGLEGAGERGVIRSGDDRTGALHVRAIFDRVENSMRVTLTSRSVDYFPAELRPVARLLANLESPNRMEFRTPNGAVFGNLDLDDSELLVQRELPRLIDDLALVQWASGHVRKISATITRDDAEELFVASSLLRGRQVPRSWNTVTITLSDEASESGRQALIDGPVLFETLVPEPFVAHIDGFDYPIGDAYLVRVDSAKLAPEYAAWTSYEDVPTGKPIRLVPGDSDQALFALATIADAGG